MVIPAEVRRKYNIVDGSYLELVDAGKELKISVLSLKDAFGIGGEEALEALRLMLESRREEREREAGA